MEIKQIMPLPAGCTVMSWDCSPCGEMYLKGEAISETAYCLALVKHEDGFEEVVPYSMETGVEQTAVIVPSRRCPECGEEMLPYRREDDPVQRYCCTCGADLSAWYWDTCPLCNECHNQDEAVASVNRPTRA